jgi:hypothetical protein
MKTKEKGIIEKLNERIANGEVLEGNSSEQISEPIEAVTIKAPNLRTVAFQIRGITPLVVLRFGAKSRNQIEETQRAGSVAKSKKKRDPKNFEELYEDAKHVSTEGWCGIPCASFRHAMIDACTLVATFKTTAKKTIFVEADGWGRDDATALVKITKGEPRQNISPVRNASGVIDLRARAMWEPGWEATVRVKFDADAFSLGDVANLLARAGQQCGICEGRPNGKKSNGCGWGLFELVS